MMKYIVLALFVLTSFSAQAATTSKSNPSTYPKAVVSKSLVKTPEPISSPTTSNPTKTTSSAKTAATLSLAAASVSSSGGSSASSITTQATSVHVEQTSGSANLPIHIDTLPGRAGIEPNINLVYNSGMRQLGLAGVGWSLDLGSISLSVKKGVPLYDGSDTYELSGMKLIYDPTAGYYRPEVEGSFSKIEKISNAWVVTDKKGTKYYYGSDDTSRMVDPANASRIFRWYLCKVIDIFGNAMNVYYHKDGAQVYPDHIYYTALEGANAAYIGSTAPSIVNFEYVAARQKSTSYISGFEVNNAYILSAIKTYTYPSTLNNSYRFTYTASASTAKDLLTSIKIDGSVENAGLIPDIKFSYSDTTSTKGFVQDVLFSPGSAPYLSYASGGNWVDEGVRFGDLNGDGYPDFLMAYYDLCSGLTTSMTGLNNKDQSFSGTNKWSVASTAIFNLSCRGGNRDNGQRFIDVDGDGLPDIVRSYFEGVGWQGAALNDGTTGFNATSNWVMPNGAYFASWLNRDYTQPGSVQLADVNGDGYLDVVVSDVTANNHNVYLNRKGAANPTTGWETTPSTKWITPADVDLANGSSTVVDINGDGLADIAVAKTGYRKVYINTGRGWSQTSAVFVTDGNWDRVTLNDGTAQILDVNGDGLPDIEIVTGIADTSNVLINTGNGWVIDNSWLMTGLQFSHMDTQFIDMNADGMIDYLNAPLGSQPRLFTNTAKVPDLLVKVDNGVGTTMTIAYDSSAHMSNQYLPFTFPVVKSLTLNTISGDRTSSYVTRYNYEGGLWDVTDREFRGFKKVTTTDPDGNYSIAYMLQDHFRKGTAYLTESYDNTGKLLGKSENFVALSPVVGTSVQFPYLVRSDNYLYGADGSLKQRSAQVMDYDLTNGNVTKKVQYGAIDITTPSLSIIADPKVVTSIDNNVLTTTIDYVNNAAQPFMSLPKLTTISDKLGTTIKKTWFYYDNSTDNNALFTNGLLTKKEDWNGDANPRLTTTYAYDVIGNLTSTTDPSNRTTSIMYDTTYKTFPVQTTNALSQTVKTYYYGINASELATDPKYNAQMYGPFGAVMAVVDANGQKMFKHYDSLGRLLKTISPLDTFDLPTSETIYTYGTNFLKVISKSRVNAGAATTIDSSTFVDGLGRVIQSKGTTATAGQYVVGEQKTYNSRGLVLSVFPSRFTSNDLNTMDPTPADTNPKVTNFYDALGRQIKALNSDGTYSNVEYDGLKTTSYDPNGHKNVSYSDSFGRMITREEYFGADGRDAKNPASAYTLYATTRYQYDALGNLTKVTDAKGNITTISYDALGRKTSMNDPDMHGWVYAYDSNGNLLSQKDALNKQLKFNYDALNRLKSKTVTLSMVSGGVTTIYDSLLASYTYENVSVANTTGRLSKVAYSSENATFNYDTLGRETSSTKNIAGVNYTVSRQYDDLNRLTKLIYPDAANVGYVYNTAGQAVGVNILNVDGSINKTIVSNVIYNAQGQMTSVVFGNGVTTQYTYDPVNFRLTRVLTQNAAAVKHQDLNYTYDSVGNIITITDAVNTGTQSFTYDALNRMLTSTGASYGTKTYAYDQIGNITQKDGLTYTYGTYGAGPHAVGSTSDGYIYRYNANGNMISKQTPTGGLYSYVYNYENRLTSIGFAPVGKVAKTIAAYYYDGDGGRTRKIVYRYSDTSYNNAETYGILVTQLGAPTFGVGVTQTSTSTIYVGNLYEIEGARRTNNIYLGSTRVAAVTGTEVDFYHNDHLGSTNVITDATGQARSLTEYEPFGKISRFEKYGTKINNTWAFFNSKLFDEESGLYYYGARYYDPKLGRFITPDTIVQAPSNPQTLNRYTYCNNNPVNLIDPTGHKWKWGNFFKAVGIAIAGAILTVVSAGTLAPVVGAYWAGVVTGAVAGATIGGTVAAATGGNIGQGLLTGAISGAVFGGIGSLHLSGLTQTLAHTAGGAVSGVINGAVTGGNIGTNALIGGISAGTSQWASSNIQIFKLSGNYFKDVITQASLGGIVGGGISAGMGGSFIRGFENGATMSAIGYTSNSFVHDYAPALINGILAGATYIPGPVGAGARVVRTVLTALSVGSEVLMSASKTPNNLPGNAVENPNRPGSFGVYGPDGKFTERWRFDEGKSGMPGWRGKDHVHVDGGKDHLPPDTPYPD